MEKFDRMYEITHEWSQFEYTLWFKNGNLERIDSSNKYTDVFTSVYRNPGINYFGITTHILEEIVGYLCRGKEDKNIKAFLELFVNDVKYYNIIKRLLKEEIRQLSDSIVRINEALQ